MVGVGTGVAEVLLVTSVELVTRVELTRVELDRAVEDTAVVDGVVDPVPGRH